MASFARRCESVSSSRSPSLERASRFRTRLFAPNQSPSLPPRLSRFAGSLRSRATTITDKMSESGSGNVTPRLKFKNFRRSKSVGFRKDVSENRASEKNDPEVVLGDDDVFTASESTMMQRKRSGGSRLFSDWSSHSEVNMEVRSTGVLRKRSLGSKTSGMIRRRRSEPSPVQDSKYASLPSMTNPEAMERYRRNLQASHANTKKYIKEGHVTLCEGIQSHKRYLFLFSGLLVVAKEKSQRSYKLKDRVRVSEIWIGDYAQEDICLAGPSQPNAFVIGWPTVTYVAKFSSQVERDQWFRALQEEIQREKDEEFPKVTTLRININSKSPQEHSVVILVNNLQTVAEVIRIAATEFEFPPIEPGEPPPFHLVVYSDNEPCQLYGFEYPFAILLSHARELIQPENMNMEVFDQLSNLANIDPALLKCQFVLKAVPGTKKKKLKGGLMSQLKRKVQMSKTDSVDSALSSSPPLSDCSTTGKVFGHSLSSSSSDGSVPDVVLMMLKFLHKTGLYAEGIFRKNAKASVLRELKDKLDQDIPVCLDDYTCHVIASLLKEYFRSLPQCLLLSEKLLDAWMEMLRLEELQAKLLMTQNILSSMPLVHCETLRHLLCLLHAVTECKGWNQMSPANLGICFAYSLLHLAEGDASLASDNMKRIPEVTQFLIENFVNLFGEESAKLLGLRPGPPIKDMHDSDTDFEAPKRQETSSTDSLLGSSRSSSVIHRSLQPQASRSQDSGLADPIISTDESDPHRSFSQSEEDDLQPYARVQFRKNATATSPERRNLLQLHIGSPAQNYPQNRAPVATPELDEHEEPLQDVSENETFERYGSVRSSKRSVDGTLHRSESGDHLIVRETIQLPPESPVFVPAPSLDRGSVSDTPLTPEDHGIILHELTRNTPSRRPARYRKYNSSPGAERSKSMSDKIDSNDSDDEGSCSPRSTTSGPPSSLVIPTEGKNCSYAQVPDSHESVKIRLGTPGKIERAKLARVTRGTPPKSLLRSMTTSGSFDSFVGLAHAIKQQSQENDSSTITDSSDESTPVVSRESSRAQELQSKANQMFGEKHESELKGSETPTAAPRKLSSQSSPLTVDTEIKTVPLAAPQAEEERRNSSPKVVYETVYQPPKLDLTTSALLSSARSIQSKQVSSQNYIVRGSPLKVRSKLPSYEEAMKRNITPFAVNRQFFETVDRKQSAQSSSSSSSSEHSPDIKPPTARQSVRGTIHVSKAELERPDHPQLLKIPVGGDRVRERIRKYDREASRRMTIGGEAISRDLRAEFKQAELRPAQSSKPSPVTTTVPQDAAKQRLTRTAAITRTPSQSTEISWSVKRLRERYASSPLSKDPLVEHTSDEGSAPAPKHASIRNIVLEDKSNCNYPVVRPPPLSPPGGYRLSAAPPYPRSPRPRSTSALADPRIGDDLSSHQPVTQYLRSVYMDEMKSKHAEHATISYV